MIGPFQGDYAFLSNFSPAVVELDGKVYPTVEHAYQAAKTLVQGSRTMIRQARTPGQAKRLGRQVPLRPDWERIKVDVMRNLLRQKFAHPDLRRLLLATAPEDLVEINTWGDRYWGVSCGAGENMLGRLLMEVRAEIAQAG
jgi:ribA/ribD-fused uncharacterized protein